MSRLVVIHFGSGDLLQGFPQVTARVESEYAALPEQFLGSLPPAPQLVEQYQSWQTMYLSLCNRQFLRTMPSVAEVDELQIDHTGVTNVSQIDFREISQQLALELNTWLNSQGFLRIEQHLRSHLHPTEDIRIILEVNDDALRRLPWHQWYFLQDYPNSYIAFSCIEYRAITPKTLAVRDRTRVLAILGNSQGIDLEAEAEFLKELKDADVTFLVNPSRQEFNTQLWDTQGWDVLFFAGHSHTEGQTGRLYINENNTYNSITIEQLEEALKEAIEQGLKLAIFNSCDGLGLALALEQLHIPIVIVMQEPVPNRVAQAFFDYFLEDFVREHLPLHRCIRRARRKLQGMENEYPGASWLPVVSQNPLVDLEKWLQLGQSMSPPSQVLPSRSQEWLPPSVTKKHYKDWGDAPSITAFYGRNNEVTTLNDWIIHDRCQLVALIGMGGIGKTTLSVKLAEQTQSHFEFVIWRSLRNAPPIQELLAEVIKTLSAQHEITLPASLEMLISRALFYLQEQRCLIVLDNVESIFQSGIHAGSYIPEYEGYGYLFDQIGRTQHQSCLLLTSREKPKELALLEGEFPKVRSLQLRGLSRMAGQQILIAKGCYGEREDLQEIAEHYDGNPLALKIAASAVKELTEGDVTEILPLLRQGRFQFDDINDILERQWERLASSEQTVMYWMAINREPVSLPELQSDILCETAAQQILAVIQSLSRRGLIERSEKHWTLQPVVMEYVTRCFVEAISAEIPAQQYNQLSQYALLIAQSNDYIRQTQIRFIVEPIVNRLSATLGGYRRIEECLRDLLAKIRDDASGQAGYAPGNILNLLCHLKTELTGSDFSYLDIRQAYLVGINLQSVNFANCHFFKTAFTDAITATFAVAFSPDGKLFASGNADGIVRIWQTTDKSKLVTCKGHTNWIWSVVFSPDSQTVATGSTDQTIKLWDAKTGNQLNTLSGHTDWIWSVAFSPNGQLIASGSNDQTIRLWDVATAQCLQIWNQHTSGVQSVAFSPDGATLASTGKDCTIKLWDVRTGQMLHSINAHDHWIFSAKFSVDGRYLVSGSHDQTIKIWDLSTKQCLRTLRGHSSYVLSLALSSDGKNLASSSTDTTVRIWDIETGECLNVLQWHPNGVWAVAFHPDGQTLVSGSNDSTVKVWNAVTGQSLKTIQGYCSGIRSLAFSANDQSLVSGGDDKILRLWDVHSEACHRTFEGHTSWIWSVGISPNQQMIASSGNDCTIRLWDLNAGKQVRTLKGHLNLVMSIAFSPRDHLLVSSSTDQTVRLWDVQTGECRRTLTCSDRVWAVAFSPDGQFFVTGSDDRTVQLWDVETGECIKAFQEHTALIFSVAFSPHGKHIASSSSDRTVKLWDVESGQCVHTLSHQGGVWEAAFSPNGQILASASDDDTIKLWDVATGECLRTLPSQTGGAWTVAFTHDGSAIAGSGQSGVIRFWEVATGKQLKAISNKRPYDQMNITGVTGLTDAQLDSLKTLGAFSEP